jgi:hypothetical protein
MDTETDSERRDIGRAILRSRGLLIFFFLLSCLALYEDVRHVSSRFHVPRDFVIQHALPGRAGWTLDVICYVLVSILMVEMVRSAGEKVEMAFFIGLIGPIVINPLRMAIPRYTSVIWWVEVGLEIVLFLSSTFLLLRVIRKTPNQDKL